MAAPAAFAVNVDPVQVQSAPGELLYAEMYFRQSDTNTPLEVSLASTEDLILLGASHQPPEHLNFYTRRNSNGSGVVTITSSRPITDRELNIIIKIKEGNAAHLQHVRTPLKSKIDLLKASLSPNERPLSPVVVVSEKDIALSLPVSTQYHAAKSTGTISEKPLTIQRIAPPSLSSSSTPKTSSSTSNIQAVAPSPAPVVTAVAAPMPITATKTVVASVPTPTITSQVQPLKPLAAPEPQLSSQPAAMSTKIEKTVSQPQLSLEAEKKPENIATESNDPLMNKFKEQQATQPKKPAIKEPIKVPPMTPVQPTTAQATYVVQSNESLWKIAERIAHAQNKPVNEVMKNIKKNNEHAFISGNVNRLRRGASLNLNNTLPKKEPIKIHASTQKKQNNTPTPKTKYRLNQAEMSLITENKQDSKLISANQNTLKNQSSKELALKVMTAREKTVKLQRNVTAIELALNQKDHRIQLLNARLAQLEQQLKAQYADKKPIN